MNLVNIKRLYEKCGQLSKLSSLNLVNDFKDKKGRYDQILTEFDLTQYEKVSHNNNKLLSFNH